MFEKKLFLKKKIEKKFFEKKTFFCVSGAATAAAAAAARHHPPISPVGLLRKERKNICRAYGKKTYLCHKLHFKCLHPESTTFYKQLNETRLEHSDLSWSYDICRAYGKKKLFMP